MLFSTPILQDIEWISQQSMLLNDRQNRHFPGILVIHGYTCGHGIIILHAPQIFMHALHGFTTLAPSNTIVTMSQHILYLHCFCMLLC